MRWALFGDGPFAINGNTAGVFLGAVAYSGEAATPFVKKFNGQLNNADPTKNPGLHGTSFEDETKRVSIEEFFSNTLKLAYVPATLDPDAPKADKVTAKAK